MVIRTCEINANNKTVRVRPKRAKAEVRADRHISKPLYAKVLQAPEARLPAPQTPEARLSAPKVRKALLRAPQAPRHGGVGCACGVVCPQDMAKAKRVLALAGGCGVWGCG